MSDAERAGLEGFEETYGEQQARCPAGPAGWQPVHTVYVPADRFSAATVPAWGAEALELATAHLAGPGELAEVFGLPGDLAADAHARVVAKLGREPVEDLRIDFEDGYGVRPAEEEDRDVTRAAEAAPPERTNDFAPARRLPEPDPAAALRARIHRALGGAEPLDAEPLDAEQHELAAATPAGCMPDAAACPGSPGLALLDRAPQPPIRNLPHDREGWPRARAAGRTSPVRKVS